ncbi:MAG: acyl-ACP--UDP-N-acetylglucosamine O-acyltransferase [Verrucomicrobiota bacterium]
MASEIHPTAIVDPGAEIGDDVVIGPYCVIEKEVRIGNGCRFQNHVTVAGPTTIGENNTFFPFGSIGQRTQDLKYEGEPTYLEIGSDNTFREFCTVNRGTSPGSKTTVGSHGNFLAYCHIAHDCIVGDHVIFSNNGTLAGHVIVEDHAILGGLTGIHQFCRIGAHAMTGGCCKIVQDIPPYMMADGNPARVRAINAVGLKRRGFSEEAIAAIKKAHRVLYREDRNYRDAVEVLREEPDRLPELEVLIDFVAASERGIS